MNKLRREFVLKAVIIGILWLFNSLTAAGADPLVQVRDPYSLDRSKSQAAHTNFKFVLMREGVGILARQDLDEDGEARFFDEFTPQTSLSWEMRTAAPREEYLIWPARMEDVKDPCSEFRLAKVTDDLGVLGRDSMIEYVSRNEFSEADDILQQLVDVYEKGEGVTVRNSYEWRLALHTHLTSVVDRVIKRLSSSGSLSRSERLSALEHVTRWMKRHRDWIEPPGRLTPQQQARIISEMMARIENCATKSYMKNYLPRDGSWPDRTLDDFKSDLPDETTRQIMQDDIDFLLEYVEKPQFRELLNRQVQESPGINAELRQQWNTLLSYGSWEGIALFKDNAAKVVGNVRLAALEKIVDIINRSASATRG